MQYIPQSETLGKMTSVPDKLIECQSCIDRKANFLTASTEASSNEGSIHDDTSSEASIDDAIINTPSKVPSTPNLLLALNELQKELSPQDPKQCLHNLVVLLGKAQAKAVEAYMENDTVLDTLPTEIGAIVLAIIALFKLDGRLPGASGGCGDECKQEFKKSGGIEVALRAMDTMQAMQTLLTSSPINDEAIQALAYMLSLLVDKPWEDTAKNDEVLLGGGSHPALLRYAETPSENELSSHMLANCRTDFEACLRYGEIVRM